MGCAQVKVLVDKMMDRGMAVSRCFFPDILGHITDISPFSKSSHRPPEAPSRDLNSACRASPSVDAVGPVATQKRLPYIERIVEAGLASVCPNRQVGLLASFLSHTSAFHRYTLIVVL